MMKNVLEIVNDDKNLVQMAEGIKLTGMDEAFSLEGPFTILAPSDIAFSKLEVSKTDEQKKEKFNELLRNHVLKGFIRYENFKEDQNLVTLGGSELKVKLFEGKVTINGAVLQGNNLGSNGIVHTLDRVIASN